MSNDLANINSRTNFNNYFENYFKDKNKDFQGKLSNLKNESVKGISLAKKGDASYIPNMDIDSDGEITMDEFNQYCDENGVGIKERVRLMTLMQSVKMVSENNEKAKEKSKESEIYAKLGDEKYEAKMDYDKDGKITKAEYNKYKNSEKEDLSEHLNIADYKNAKKAYSTQTTGESSIIEEA